MIPAISLIALRIINFADYREHADPLFKNHEILRINDFVKLQNMFLVYDSMNNRLPSILNNIYTNVQSVHNHASRNSLKMKLSIPVVQSTTYGLNSIKYQSIMIWNQLIDEYPEIIFQKL